MFAARVPVTVDTQEERKMCSIMKMDTYFIDSPRWCISRSPINVGIVFTQVVVVVGINHTRMFTDTKR